MPSHHACLLLLLGLLAVCDGSSLFSAVKAKAKSNVMHLLANKVNVQGAQDAAVRKLQECPSDAAGYQMACTAELTDIKMNYYSKPDCSGDVAVSVSYNEIVGASDDGDAMLITPDCTAMGGDSGGVYYKYVCTDGAVGMNMFMTNDCSDTATEMPADQMPGGCMCDDEMKAADLAEMSAMLCMLDCGDKQEMVTDCDTMDTFFKTESCASDCTSADKAAIAAAMANDSDAEQQKLALCDALSNGAATTTAGLVAAALVSFGAMLFA